MPGLRPARTVVPLRETWAGNTGLIDLGFRASKVRTSHFPRAPPRKEEARERARPTQEQLRVVFYQERVVLRSIAPDL